jgi:hypothetical protein
LRGKDNIDLSKMYQQEKKYLWASITGRHERLRCLDRSKPV